MKAVIDGREYIDVTEVVKKTGYSVDHVRRLLRQGKVDGVKRGNMWFVDPKSLEQYRQDVNY